MSFERFSSSDVYVFEHVGGGIECCGCWLALGEEDGWFYNAATPRDMLIHLEQHENVGHDVGTAPSRIKSKYPDLDAIIYPYKSS